MIYKTAVYRARAPDARFRSAKERGFFNSAVGVLQTLVIALGAGLGIWGIVNLLEGYGNDNPGAKSQGIKQLMAGGGVALIGTTLVPLLRGLVGLGGKRCRAYLMQSMNGSKIF